MAERYWIHSDPTGWNGANSRAEDTGEGIPDDAVITTDRRGDRYAVHPDGRYWPACPGHHPKPVPGTPVWCEQCRDRIHHAIGRLPDLAAQLYDHTGEQALDVDPAQPIVSCRPIERRFTRASHTFNVTLGWQIRLGCGHTTYRGDRPEQDTLLCGVCAAAPTPQPGRLAAGATQTDGTRHGTRTGSPSGSPAWDAVEQLVAFACRAEDKLRGRLGHSPVDRRWWAANADHRARCLTDACSYLATWCTALLSSREATRAGRDILKLERRAEKAVGLDRLTHHLPGPCPRCNKRGRLRRDDGDELVQCSACRATWAWDYYQLLAKMFADGQGAVG